MKDWTLAQWGQWAKPLPPHTRVFVQDDVFEALCLKLIANERFRPSPTKPTFCVLIRTIRVVPEQWRDRRAA